MDAVMVDVTAQVDLNRCIGCGLCVPTCDVDAIRLKKKDKEQRYEPPDTFVHTYIKIAMERKKSKG